MSQHRETEKLWKSQVANVSTHQFGVNVAGYLTGEFGLGESARAIIRSLEAVGVPCALNNFEVPWHRNGDHTLKDFSDTNPYRFNLVAVNVDMAPEFHELKGAEYFQERYNIATWFWELPTFPDEWLPRFNDYQEIWVASQFCAEALAKVSPIPVVKMNWSVDIEELEAVSDKARFGLRESDFVFLFTFDFMSSFERKNPLAVIQAFRKAFGEMEDVVLVLKSINSGNDPESLNRLKEAATGLNIRILDAHLDREVMHSLFASSDCYVSLHRSEGLGLGLARSMSMGKPVIATAYSGNLDFMSINNSFLVKYTLVELDRDYGPYRKGSVWAEPDIAHAANLMASVYEHRNSAMAIGERAREDIRRVMDPFASGKEMVGRLLRL
jgi:glycosyltransferase involved in cell wall biosynthesis